MATNNHINLWYVRDIPEEKLRLKALKQKRRMETNRYHRELCAHGLSDTPANRIRFSYHPEDYLLPNVTEEQLHRISVNYVRHELTGYDALIEKTSKYPTADEWYRLIKEITLLRIAKTYPKLERECWRQIALTTMQ